MCTSRIASWHRQASQNIAIYRILSRNIAATIFRKNSDRPGMTLLIFHWACCMNHERRSNSAALLGMRRSRVTRPKSTKYLTRVDLAREQLPEHASAARHISVVIQIYEETSGADHSASSLPRRRASRRLAGEDTSTQILKQRDKATHNLLTRSCACLLAC